MHVAAIALVAILTACAAQPAPAPVAPAVGTLEMRTYFLVLLRRGPAWTAEKTEESKRLFEGHMANIEAMAKSRKLLIAGPMDAPPTEPNAIAGLFLFDVKDRAEVEALIANDPAIAAGRLTPEILTWYGPANISYPGKL